MTLDVVRTVLAIAAVLIAFAFSIWLWRIGGRGSTARQLSVLLAVEGFTLATSGAVLLPYLIPYLVPYISDPRMPQAAAHFAFDVALLALYPPFLAHALRTRWTLPFAKMSVRIALVIVAVAIYTFVMTGGEHLPRRVPPLYLAMFLVFVYAFAVAFHAWRTATSETQRRTARAFVIGFGIRDLSWSIVYGSQSFFIFTATDYAQINPYLQLMYALGTLLEVPLIAYAILSTRLFDIDLRIKWTVRQSTLAAIVIAIVYFTTEAADRLLSQELGPWPGLAAAAVIVYLLAPLQRLSERVANHVMPKTVSTPEYLAYRKMQIYEAALTEALGGDGISAKERAILTRLLESLEVSPDDARAMENQLLARRAARAAAPIDPIETLKAG